MDAPGKGEICQLRGAEVSRAEVGDVKRQIGVVTGGPGNAGFPRHAHAPSPSVGGQYGIGDLEDQVDGGREGTLR